MARKMPGRQIARPAQGKNEYSGTKARRSTVGSPWTYNRARTTVHARPNKRVY